MEPLRLLLQTTIATALAALLAFSAARIRFSLPRVSRTALDVLFLLPLAFSPSAMVYLTVSFMEESWSVVLAEDCITALPLFYLCAWMGFRKVSSEAIDAARLQGLGHCGIFWRVFFPPAWRWLSAGFALGLLRAWMLPVLALYSK